MKPSGMLPENQIPFSEIHVGMRLTEPGEKGPMMWRVVEIDPDTERFRIICIMEDGESIAKGTYPSGWTVQPELRASITWVDVLAPVDLLAAVDRDHTVVYGDV